MRIIAAIYLTIALADFVFWLLYGAHEQLFPTPYFYLTWSLYLLSLLALLGYIVGRPLLNQRVWQVVLMVYVCTRAFELMSRGLVMHGDNLPENLNIIFSYLWLVIPPALAMWYLGFTRAKVVARDAGHSSGAKDFSSEKVVPH